MWSYLTTDYFINPLPSDVENIADDPESVKARRNDLLLGRYFPSAVTFDNDSACACLQKKMRGWKQPMANVIRSKEVVR
jgi:hypothetical protein